MLAREQTAQAQWLKLQKDKPLNCEQKNVFPEERRGEFFATLSEFAAVTAKIDH